MTCAALMEQTAQPGYTKLLKKPIPPGVDNLQRWIENAWDLGAFRECDIVASLIFDAEGYDDHVLKGMSFRPRALSFEFNRLLPQAAERCFGTSVLSRGYEFNFSRGLDLKYVSENWMSGQELCSRLSDFAEDEEYGDVFARSAERPS